MLLSASLNCSRWAEVLIVHTKKVNLHVHEYVWSCLIYAKDLAALFGILMIIITIAIKYKNTF